MNNQELLINNLLSNYEIQKRVSAIPSNSTFILKDLFTDTEWLILGNDGTRIGYGKAFAAIIKENPDLKVEFMLPKKGSQKYKKL